MIFLCKILQFSISFLEILCCYYFFDLMFKRKEIKWNIIVFGTSFILAILTNINRDISLYSSLFTALLVVAISIVSSLIFYGKPVYIFISTALYYMAIIIFELFFIFTIGTILNEPDFGRNISNNYNIWRSLGLLFSRLDLFIIYLIFKNKYKSKFINIKPYYKILVVTLVLGIWGIYCFQNVYIANKVIVLSGKWFIYIFFLANFIIILLVKNIIVREKEKAKIEAIRAELIEYNYKKIYECYNSSSIIFHDLKNHIEALYLYISENNLEKALKYIENLREPITELDSIKWSGNKMIDFILNYKLLKANKEGIQINYSIEKMKKLSITDNELCALLTNLIDNALEACQYVEKDNRWISVAIRNINNMLVVNIKNSYKRKPQRIKNRFVSSKKDKIYHGIGLSSVQNVVDKYEGILECLYDENEFCVNLTIFI